MFADEAEDYPSEVSFRCSTLGYALGPTYRGKTRLEKLARDKHSSLLQTFINYGRENF